MRDERKQFKKGNATMKKFIKVLAISLVAIMMCMTLVSCSRGPVGTYGRDDVSLTFPLMGDKLEISYGSGDRVTTVSGTFAMGEDDKGNQTITITLPEPTSLFDSYNSVYLVLNGTRSYNAGNDNGGDYIEIGGIKYYKK